MIKRIDFPVDLEGDVDAALGVIRTESREELDGVRREFSLRPSPGDENIWQLLDGADCLLFIDTDELLEVCRAVLSICGEEKETPHVVTSPDEGRTEEPCDK